MNVVATELEEVKIIEPTVYEDSRGSFFESWNDARFRDIIADVDFVQDNHSVSGKHVLRGLHYQVEEPQGKLVRVVRGSAFDVAVDIRRSSPTFGQAIGVVLTAESRRQVWIPPGFAHGFLALTDGVEFLYKCTEYYAPHLERTILWNDPQIDIGWPLPDDANPMISEKDRNGLPLAAAEVFE